MAKIKDSMNIQKEERVEDSFEKSEREGEIVEERVFLNLQQRGIETSVAKFYLYQLIFLQLLKVTVAIWQISCSDQLGFDGDGDTTLRVDHSTTKSWLYQ